MPPEPRWTLLLAIAVALALTIEPVHERREYNYARPCLVRIWRNPAIEKARDFSKNKNENTGAHVKNTKADACI